MNGHTVRLLAKFGEQREGTHGLGALLQRDATRFRARVVNA